MSRGKAPVAPEVLEQHIEQIVKSRASYLEKKYPQFGDSTVENAGDAARLMSDLNSAFTICTGLGVVARIVAGNDVVRDFHDEEDPGSAVPLSSSAINALVTLTAEILEGLADRITRTADDYGDRGPA